MTTPAEAKPVHFYRRGTLFCDADLIDGTDWTRDPALVTCPTCKMYMGAADTAKQLAAETTARIEAETARGVAEAACEAAAREREGLVKVLKALTEVGNGLGAVQLLHGEKCSIHTTAASMNTCDCGAKQIGQRLQAAMRNAEAALANVKGEKRE